MSVSHSNPLVIPVMGSIFTESIESQNIKMGNNYNQFWPNPNSDILKRIEETLISIDENVGKLARRVDKIENTTVCKGIGTALRNSFYKIFRLGEKR